jgi:hypothetical protein
MVLLRGPVMSVWLFPTLLKPVRPICESNRAKSHGLSLSFKRKRSGENPARRLEPGMFMKTQPVSEFLGAGKWYEGRLSLLKMQGLQELIVAYSGKNQWVLK